MKIIFIRHGFADHNQGFLEEGESAYSSLKYRYSRLTEVGHKQAREADVPRADIVFVSPLIRCIETARDIFGSSKLLYLSDGLLETQGPFPCNWREPKGLIETKYANVNTDLLSPNYSLSQKKESDARLHERAEDTLTYLMLKAKSIRAASITIVTHNDWLESIFNRKFRNGEVYTIETSS
jgi:broad specificity phosphatase PhoE